MSSDDFTRNLDDHELLVQLVTLVRGLAERLQSLEDKVDERLYDTRPMWEAVQVQMNELRESVQVQMSELRRDMATSDEMAKGFRKLDSKWEMLAREVRDLYADERELERRVGNLESKVS
jgi:SMC interacting uncharacterized protein involved in chromosome segregation